MKSDSPMPLRQEDYQATAEENRRLKTEVEALKPKPTSDPGPGRTEGGEEEAKRRWPARVVLATILLTMLVWGPVGVQRGCAAIREGSEHSNSPVSCYEVDQTTEVWTGQTHRPSQPWDPYYLWERRTLHYTSAKMVSGSPSFASRADGVAFATKWNLKVCP
jgi:hypothetical protein